MSPIKRLRCFVVGCNNEYSSRQLLPTSEPLKTQRINVTFVLKGMRRSPIYINESVHATHSWSTRARVRACVPRTEVWVIPVRLKYEVEAGPDLIPSRSGVWTLRSAGLYRYQHVEVDLSLFVSERICGVRCWKLRHYSFIPFLLSLSVYSELTAIRSSPS